MQGRKWPCWSLPLSASSTPTPGSVEFCASYRIKNRMSTIKDHQRWSKSLIVSSLLRKPWLQRETKDPRMLIEPVEQIQKPIPQCEQSGFRKWLSAISIAVELCSTRASMTFCMVCDKAVTSARFTTISRPLSLTIILFSLSSLSFLLYILSLFYCLWIICILFGILSILFFSSHSSQKSFRLCVLSAKFWPSKMRTDFDLLKDWRKTFPAILTQTNSRSM